MPQQNTPLLQVDGVSRIYRSTTVPVTALNKVSCHFASGEFTAICGRSGAGKSTLLQIIGGLEAPDEGQVRLGECSIYSLSEAALAALRGKRIGFIFQSYNLIQEMNLLDNCRLPFDINGKSYQVQKEDEVLEALGLTERKAHYPSELSGGEQQRTAIARAVLMEPALILADEPTGNLDHENSRIFMKMMREMNLRYGLTILMVTHDRDLAAGCDRIITLDDGKIIQDERLLSPEAL